MVTIIIMLMKGMLLIKFCHLLCSNAIVMVTISNLCSHGNLLC